MTQTSFLVNEQLVDLFTAKIQIEKTGFGDSG